MSLEDSRSETLLSKLSAGSLSQPRSSLRRSLEWSPAEDAHENLAVYELDPLLDSRWQRLIATHPRASVYHTRHWQEALRDTYGYEPVAFSTSSRFEPLTNAVVCCRVRSRLTGSRIVSLPFSDHCDILVNDRIELHSLLSFLRASAGEKPWRYVEVRPGAMNSGNSDGFGPSASYMFHRLDLRKSLDELFDSFHKDCVQRKIARAERERLHYEEGLSDSHLTKFYRLFVMARQRLGLPPPSIAWFRKLIAKFEESLQIRIVSKDGLPIASILTLYFRNQVVYKYGCSDRRYNRLGSMPLLFWRTIQDAKRLGITELDLGRTDIDNPGLITFKDRLGAARTIGSYWRYPTSEHFSLAKWIRPAVRRIISVAPNSLLVAAGEFLYPHIG